VLDFLIRGPPPAVDDAERISAVVGRLERGVVHLVAPEHGEPADRRLVVRRLAAERAVFAAASNLRGDDAAAAYALADEVLADLRRAAEEIMQERVIQIDEPLGLFPREGGPGDNLPSERGNRVARHLFLCLHIQHPILQPYRQSLSGL
jgi:hypothetical protein